MRITDVFRGMLISKVPGPTPSFTELHLIRAVEIFGDKEVGRKVLSRKLRLGEGSVRTLIARLLQENLISVSRKGCNLTLKGRKIYDKLKSILIRFSPIDANPLTDGKYNFGILVRNSAHKIRYGIEQRDAVVKTGAKGATIFVYKNGKLIIPSISDDVMSDYPTTAKKVIEIYQPRENDVIIIGGDDKREKAEDGARMAAWTLVDLDNRL